MVQINTNVLVRIKCKQENQQGTAITPALTRPRPPGIITLSSLYSLLRTICGRVTAKNDVGIFTHNLIHQ